MEEYNGKEYIMEVNVQEVLLVDIDMDNNMDMRGNTTHIKAILNVNGRNNKKILLLMEQGEGECFYS